MCSHKNMKEVGANLMSSGADTTYLDEGNNCQIDTSGPNFNEVQKVVPKQSNEIGCISAGYRYSYTEALPIYTCACALRRVWLRPAHVRLYAECTTIRARAANKCYRYLTY